MEQEELVQEQTQADMTNDYIEQIKNLKANSVSKADYDKLRAENKQLLDAVVNGNSSVVSEPAKPKRSFEEIGKELASTDWATNKDFFALSEEFREAMIEQKGIDPWMYKGEPSDRVEYTDKDYDDAARIEEFINHMHDFDDEASQIYNAEINRIIPPKKGVTGPRLNTK